MNPETEATPQEALALKQLRERVQDILPEFKDDFRRHDLNLLRFIRARDANVKKAEEMLRKCMEYRRLQDINNIFLRKLPDGLEQEFPTMFVGRDKKGYLVGLAKPGNWEIRKVVANGKKEDFLLLAMQKFEAVVELCKSISAEDKFYIQMYAIVDCEGFSLRQLASKEVLELGFEMLQIYEGNCPECIRQIRVINPPKLFEIFWNLIKPLLTARTMSKISIVCNKEKYKAMLLEDIHEDNLPSEYGGAISYCHEYRIENCLDALPKFKIYSENEMKGEEIPARQNFKIEMDAAQGSQISWNYKTLDYDIGFKVEYDNGIDETKQIIKNCRVDSHRFVQKGMIPCENSGKYTLTFDNTFSRFTPKSLYYFVENIAFGTVVKESNEN